MGAARAATSYSLNAIVLVTSVLVVFNFPIFHDAEVGEEPLPQLSTLLESFPDPLDSNSSAPLGFFDRYRVFVANSIRNKDANSLLFGPKVEYWLGVLSRMAHKLHAHLAECSAEGSSWLGCSFIFLALTVVFELFWAIDLLQKLAFFTLFLLAPLFTLCACLSVRFRCYRSFLKYYFLLLVGFNAGQILWLVFDIPLWIYVRLGFVSLSYARMISEFTHWVFIFKDSFRLKLILLALYLYRSYQKRRTAQLASAAESNSSKK